MTIIVLIIVALTTYYLVTRGDQLNSDLNEIVNTFSHKEAATAKPMEVSNDYKQALVKAQEYVDTLHLSEEGLRDKLRGKPDYFSANAAQYAIEHVKADYRANAVIRAREYAWNQHMDAESIDAKLTGIVDKFTPADADYAIQHVNDKPLGE
ncbi:Ltp family lipoprotein [Bombiscardovia apis]|nr:Ltp family lipoprotein [Bombiscardovia apis]